MPAKSVSLVFLGLAVLAIGLFMAFWWADQEKQRVRSTFNAMRAAAALTAETGRRAPAVDAWGEPIVWRCAESPTSRVCFSASGAADRRLQPSTQRLLALPENDVVSMLRALNELYNRPRDNESGWLEQWNIDIVMEGDEQITGISFESSTHLDPDIPPHVARRSALFFGFPAQVLFAAAFVTRRRADTSSG